MPKVTPLSDNEFNIELTDEELIIIQTFCMSIESKPYALLSLLFKTSIHLMATRLQGKGYLYGNTD